MNLGKDEGVTFDPAAPALRWRLWTRLITANGPRIHIFWGRVAAFAVVLALAAWLALAGATWAWLRYRTGFTAARYTDLVLPWRWEAHRRALGEHHLLVGRLALGRHEPALGLAHLRAGVARVPGDLPARRLLALTYLRFGRADAALDTLVDGAPAAADNLDYLKFTCTLMQELQADDRLLSLARRLLPAQPTDRLAQRYLALQAATAHFERGRYDDAEDLLQRWQLSRSVEGEVLLARCDWERGYPELALLRLHDALSRFPRRDALNLELARCYRTLGQTDRARQHAVLRRLDDPTGPGPRIDLIYAYHDDGDRPARDREIETFLADFPTDPQALLLLAWFGADRGDAAVVRRAAAPALARGQPSDPFVMAETQAELFAGHYAAAHALVDRAQAAKTARLQDFGSLLNGLDAVALHALRDPEGAKLHLGVFLAHGRLRAVDALLLARLLGRVGADLAARRVLDRAVEVDPLNQAALTELIRLEALAANPDAVARHVPALLAMRKPSRLVLQSALKVLYRPQDVALSTQVLITLSHSPRSPTPAAPPDRR